jgi:hypothetical protein
LTPKGFGSIHYLSNQKYNMKKFLSILSCGLLLGLSSAFAADPVNTTCPVKGKKVDASSKTAEVEVTFCCGKCKDKFDADVLAGLKKFAAAKEGECPISGKPVKASKSSKATIGVCCGGCAKKVKADPKKHLADVK